MITLFIIFLTTTGSWQLSGPDFKTIDQCEGFRQAAVGYAMADTREGLTLISQCVKPGEMAKWDTFKGPGRAESKSLDDKS